MINDEELKYICEKSYTTPYPGDDYAYEAINNISKALIIFRKKYDGKKYNVTLNNGEEFFFEIKKNNLAHLLGIDFKEMINNPKLKPLLSNVLDFKNISDINSYDVISRIVYNADKVIAHDELNSNRLLNYYKIMIKTRCFLEMSSFDKFDFGVMNFNKSIYEELTKSNFSPKASKYIFLMNEENIPYFMMGLKNDHDKSTMVPETFIVSNKLYYFLHNQVLLFPVEILIANNDNIEKIGGLGNEEKQKVKIK